MPQPVPFYMLITVKVLKQILLLKQTLMLQKHIYCLIVCKNGRQIALIDYYQEPMIYYFTAFQGFKCKEAIYWQCKVVKPGLESILIDDYIARVD